MNDDIKLIRANGTKQCTFYVNWKLITHNKFEWKQPVEEHAFSFSSDFLYVDQIDLVVPVNACLNKNKIKINSAKNN